MKIGLLTAGSDSPGVNAAIRGFGKAASIYDQYAVCGWVLPALHRYRVLGPRRLN